MTHRLDWKSRGVPEHLEARREWATNDSQHMSGELREILPEHVDLGPVMRSSLWISRDPCFAVIQSQAENSHIHWAMRPSPPFPRGWDWSVTPPPSFQALRNTSTPFDSSRIPPPQNIVELIEVSTQTDGDPYIHPPVTDLVPFRPIQWWRPIPPMREAEVMDVHGVIHGVVWLLEERPEVDIEPPTREPELMLEPIGGDDSIPELADPLPGNWIHRPPGAPSPPRERRPGPPGTSPRHGAQIPPGIRMLLTTGARQIRDQPEVVLPRELTQTKAPPPQPNFFAHLAPEDDPDV